MLKVKINADKMDTKARRDKCHAVEREMEKVLNSEAFKAEVLKMSTFKGERSSFKDMPRLEVYNKIMDSTEWYDPEADNTLDIFIDDYVSLYHPREMFAQTFAVRFLIPPAKVKKIIDKDFHSKKLSFADVLYLKRYFGVSALAMLRTLKDLEYLSRSNFEEYQKLDPSPYEEVFFGQHKTYFTI